jgi:hypothetical protein
MAQFEDHKASPAATNYKPTLPYLSPINNDNTNNNNNNISKDLIFDN